MRAVLLLNMGSINNLDEVELFLTNMFNDRNILTIKSDFLRKLIATIIVKSRASKVRESYKRIGGGSQMLSLTKKLREKLQAKDENRFVAVGMRYTPPFEIEALRECRARGVDEIVLFPMYPQYSTTTTKSSFEATQDALKELDYSPKLTIIEKYFDSILYNRAIIERITQTLNRDSAENFTLIFSAHGLPQKVVDSGDPYQREIEKNVEILTQILNDMDLNFNSIELAYQSKVGPMKWLEPSLESKLKSLKNKRAIIYPIAFTIDNSETDLELSIEYKELANELEFKDFRVCRCLNDSDKFVEAIEEIIEKH